MNPLQEGFFAETSDFVERKIQLNFEGKKAGELTLATKFNLIH